MAQLQIGEYHSTKRESSLSLQLVAAIARPEHMDYTIQKAVELGVQQIIPVITERSPPLDVKLLTKREQHWRKIIISATEQCGRNGLPTLHNIIPISVWLGQPVSGLAMVLSPQAPQSLPTAIQPLVKSPTCPLTVLVGAEGGLTEAEITQASQAGYVKVSLGPRILRTETAAVAALAVCQALLGDW
jgi:16S rRNA (uracil1498-N3)-methyltransferase